ncbi:hypothetical protein EON79_14220 [bacterium]|nr:MAG: hypothetical protein EON79_14220 [bacterium]
MSQKPFDLATALDDLRAETASPEARIRARQAMTRRPRTPLRLVMVAGALALLVLPVALRTQGSQASALTLDQALKASIESPYVIQIIDKYNLKGEGEVEYHSETIWAPYRRVERLFFHNGVPGLEVRRVPGLFFQRHIPHEKARQHLGEGWKPYEDVLKTKEPVGGTEGTALMEGQRAMLATLDPLKPFRSDGTYSWFRVDTEQVWKVEVATKRISSVETTTDKARFVSRFEYPDSIASDRLDVPPPGTLPRFDLDQEKADMERLIREGDRTTVVGGKKVKLVGIFQELAAPHQPIYVAYLGNERAKASGLRNGQITTMKSIPPKVVATVFRAPGYLKTLDVEIPVPGTKRFVTFKGVRVRPVSDGIRSTLRTPSFR